MVEGRRPLSTWHQTTNALHVSMSSGHTMDVQWWAANFSRAFTLEIYFSQVAFATDAFIRENKAVEEL